MAQEYKYVIVGDTKLAVKATEDLTQATVKLDKETLDYNVTLKKTELESQKAFGKELETRIKATDGIIKSFGGTVSLLTGTLSTVVGSLGVFGLDEDQVSSFQRAATSVLALGTGAQQAITGLKDLTEVSKINQELTILATESELKNTIALAANADAAGGVTLALSNATTAIAAESNATGVNTTSKGANTASLIANTTQYTTNTGVLFTNAAGTEALTLATGKLTIAQRILNVVAKANPYIAIASIILGVGAAIIGLTGILGKNTDAEEKNTDARKENETAMRTEEDAALKLLRARGASNVQLAEETLQIAKNRKARALQALSQSQIEDSLLKLTSASQATKDAQKELNNATVDLQVAEAELEKTRKEARSKAAADAKTQADKNTQLRNERLEREGVIQLIKQEGEELVDALIYKDRPWWEWTEVWVGQYSDLKKELGDVVITLKRVGGALNVTNLQDLAVTIESIGLALEEIDFNEFEDSIKFLSEEQLTILKRLRGELNTELKQQLFDREQQYKDDLALFADNEEAKKRLTEEYEKDKAKIRRQYTLQVAKDTIGITSEFLGTIAEINQASLELQLQQAAGNQAAIDKINKDALEKQKKLRTAQVLVTTAESILNGYNATSTLPPPFNFIAGTALALAYGALGAKTIQTINATTLEGGGGGGGFNNIPGGGAAFGSINLGGAAAPTAPFPTGILPGIGGGRLGVAGVGETQMPIRAYVLAGDVENGVQANLALNNRRRLAG